MPKSLSLRLTYLVGYGTVDVDQHREQFFFNMKGWVRKIILHSPFLSKGPVNNHQLVILKEL